MEYTWLIYALLSALCASFVAIFAKIGLKGMDEGVATTIRALIMFGFLMLIVLFQGKAKLIGSFFDSKIALFIVLSGIAGALSWLFYFSAIKQGKVTSVVSIDRLSIIFTMVFAFVFLNEKITLKSAIGVIVIVVGALIIAIDK